jgi:hypothetical protein
LHFYGPGMMGAAVSTVAPTDSANARGEGRMGLRNTIAPTNSLNLQRGWQMRIQNTPALTAFPTLRGRAFLRATSKINEITQDDIMGAVLTTQIAPGLTFSQALADARKAAKLAAALSA